MIEGITDTLNAWFRSHMEQVHTALPGKIETYSAGTRKASVKPLVKLRTQDGGSLSLPVVDNVPVVFPGTPKVGISFPVEKGDGCLILFMEASIGNFLEGTREVDAESAARFQLTDAVCIPGLFSFRSTPAPTVEIQLDAVTGITLKTGDALGWAPNTLPVDPFTGLSHSVGIIKLKGA